MFSRLFKHARSFFGRSLPTPVTSRRVAWLLAGIMAGGVSHGATIIWAGGSGGNANIWNRGQNWVGNAQPTSTDTAQFDNTPATTNLAPSIGTTATSVGAITFISGTTDAFNISGTATLTLGSATVSGITNSSATNQQFSVTNIGVAVNQTWTVGSTGNLSFSSNVALGANTLSLAGSSTGTGTISGVISGTGSISKSGSGTWTLSNAANSYSGPTTVTGGILSVSTLANGGANSGIGASSNAATNLVLNGGTLQYTGAAVSTDRLFSVGTSGGTIDASGTGTLAFTNTGAIGFNAQSGARLFTLTGTGTGSLASSIGDNGGATSLTKSGAGTWILTGTNTYTGGTTISAGTLQGNTTSLQGNMTNNGTVVFDQATTGTYSGTMSGTGAVTKQNTGTLVVSGANSYSGATTISAGTLQLGASSSGANSALGTAAAGTTVSSGAALDLNGYSIATGEALNLSGTGIGNTGALTNSSGTASTYNGTVTLAANSSIGGAGNITLSAGIAGNFLLTKSDSSTLFLNGSAGTRTGGAQVDGGTLQLGNTAALGAAGQTVTLNGGTLNLATNTTTNAYATSVTASSAIVSNRASAGAGITHTLGTLSINGSTLSVSAGTNVSANTAYGLTFGATTLSANGVVFDIAKNGTANGTLTLGALSGNFSFTKQGAGSLVLNSASARSAGTTTLSAGTMKLGSTSALGTTGTSLSLLGGILDLATNTTVNAYNTTIGGATTILSNKATAASAGITHTLGTLSIGAQTLTVASGSNVANNSAYGLTFGATTLTGNATFDVAKNGTANGTLTLGAVNDGGLATTITKSGTGVMTLGTNATSLVNGTAVNITAGTLNSNTASSLGSLANVTLSTGATLGVGASQTVGALNGTGGTTSLGANTLTIGNATNNLTSSYGGAITGTGGITKAGTGDVTLSGTNTYTGTTTVNAGSLIAGSNSALGGATGAVTVNTNGTLALAGGVTLTKSASLSLAGTGASGSLGALVSNAASGQTSQYSGNITLTGNATVGVGSGLFIIGEGSTFTNTIALGANTLTFNTTATPTVSPSFVPFPSYTLDPANVLVNASISGTGGITKTGAGTLLLYPNATGGSTFTGATTVTGGTLILDAQVNNPAINSNQIYVGNSGAPGTADSVVLQMGQAASPPSSGSIIGTKNAGTNGSSSSLTVYGDGLFNMNGGSNGFRGLTLEGGHVTGTGTSVLTLDGSGGTFLTTLTSTRTAVIDTGKLVMSAANFNFAIASGATSGIDLRVDSIIQTGIGYSGGSAGTSLIKSGAGQMLLTGANTYSGITNVNAGILTLQHNTALGQVGSSIGDTSNGTVVANGAQLRLQGGVTIGNETLTLNGTGVSATGALRSFTGTNLLNGFVNLATDSTIYTDTGSSLTITNTNGVNATILNGTAAGKNVIFAGAGNTTINGGIGSNITNLTKNDGGTLTLAGTNAYAGATNVTAGAVKVTNSNALVGSGVTVSSGAAVQFDGGIAVGGVSSTINGTGVSSGGAIENVSGANTYSGNVTLAGNSRIGATSGSLGLSGNITGAGYSLDVGGAGNTTYSGVISGSGTALTKSDAGTVTLSGTSANTFTGGVTVNQGTLELNKTAGVSATGTGNATVNAGTLKLLAANQISDTARVSVFGTGRFDLNGFNETIGSFAGTGTIDVGSATLITGGDNTSTTFGGTLAGNGVIKKVGTGDLTFNASMTFAGEINLNGGEITLAGINLTIGTLRITGNTTLDFGNNAASVLTATNVILENGATLTITNWVDNQDFFYANGSFYALVSGVPTPVNQNVRGGPPQNQITFTGFSNNSTVWQSLDRQITPAPEPSTYGAIFLGCCLGLLGWRRRSRRQAAQA